MLLLARFGGIRYGNPSSGLPGRHSALSSVYLRNCYHLRRLNSRLPAPRTTTFQSVYRRQTTFFEHQICAVLALAAREVREERGLARSISTLGLGKAFPVTVAATGIRSATKIADWEIFGSIDFGILIIPAVFLVSWLNSGRLASSRPSPSPARSTASASDLRMKCRLTFSEQSFFHDQKIAIRAARGIILRQEGGARTFL